MKYSSSLFFFVHIREMKCEGIQGIRRLTKHHPEVLVSQLHTVTLAIIAEVRGLFQTFLFICFLFD